MRPGNLSQLAHPQTLEQLFTTLAPSAPVFPKVDSWPEYTLLLGLSLQPNPILAEFFDPELSGVLSC